MTTSIFCYICSALKYCTGGSKISAMSITVPKHNKNKYKTKLKHCGDIDVKYRVYPRDAAHLARKLLSIAFKAILA